MHLSLKVIAAQVAENGSFTISTRRGNFQIDLIRHDMRSDDYRTELTGENNQRVALVKSDVVRTFKGTVRGMSDSQVRFTIDQKIVEGIIWMFDDEFLVEPAQKYLTDADAGDFIFYRAADLVSQEIFACGFKSPKNSEAVQSAEITATIAGKSLWVIRIATEVDFEYVIASGGAIQANNEILSIMNQVEGVYKRELGITFQVVFQNAWTATDPCNANDDTALLNQFTTYWNANRSNIARDIAHLWSGNAGGGIAWFGVACNPTFPGYHYSLNGRVYVPRTYAYTAHEIAHQFGASHTDNEAACPGTLMADSDGTPAQMTSCPFSRNEILTYLNNQPICLSLNENRGFDFDGDGQADISIYRNGIWYLLRSDLGLAAVQFGSTTDKITPADFDGD